MSKLDDLIKQYCPDGVEYKRLGDIATDIFRGAGIRRDQVVQNGVPCVRYGEIYTDYGIHFDSCISHTTLDAVAFPKWFSYGDILFAITGESVEEIAKSTAYLGHDRCLAGGDIVVLKHNENPMYLSYALSTTDAQRQKSKGKTKSKVVHSSVPAIESIVVPIPPRPIQDRIAEDLDAFTKLTAELTAELTARRAQYEYYRDKLLTFDDETAIVKRIKDMLDQTCGGPEKVEYRPLSDVVGIRRGKRVTRQDLFENGEYPVFQNSLVPLGYYDEYNVESETPYIICAGAAGDIGYCSGKFWAADDCFFIEHPEKITRRYVYYFLLTKQEYLKSKVRKASVPRLAHEFVDKLEIPIPPFAVQQEIVSVLDKFNNLTTDISTGLPAEISLRQKQYEHYRDRLLSFNGGGGYSLENEMNFVKFRTLPEISVNCDKDRKPVTKCNRNSGQFPYYGASGIVDYVDNYLLDGDYLLVSEDGANLVARNTPIAFSVSGKCWVNNHAHVLKFSTYELRRYVEYYLNSIDLSKYISGGAQPKLNQDNLNKISIPIPPMEWIKKIVNALDKLFLLCESLSEGLPAEIEARKKQYEYYRDKLLDFKEKKA